MSPDGENTKLEESEAASPSATSLPRPTSNSVKKERLLQEEGSSDDDDKPIGLKKLKQAAKRINKPIAKVTKKEESDDEQKMKKKKKSSTSDKVVKPETEELKKVLKKEKKVYDLPGQKRDPPEQRDPSRIFYETLYQQVPTSEMAQIWMMECGLLPAQVAKQVFEKKQKKAQTLKSPAKSPVSSVKNTSTKSVTVKKNLSTVTKSSKSVTVKKEQPASADTVKKNKSLGSSKKRKAADVSGDEDESDDDFEVISQPKKRKLAG